MATRKKRIQEVTPATPAGTATKETPRYQDAFQRKSERRIEEVSRKVEGKGRTILYALGALAVLAILLGIFVSWNRRSNAAAQTALGKAIETSEAQVTTQPPLAGAPNEKTFKTEKERAEAAIAEFQGVADKYGSPVREKAQYFIAVNKISIDRPAAVGELENLAKSSGEVGTLSKFALAQAKEGDGKLDEAAALYGELAALSDPVISKDTINFALASIYEKQGKKQDAANIFYNIAKPAYEAKDADGKAVQPSQTAREARAKLQSLDPTRAAEIKEPTPEMPQMPGGFPLG
jgi:predicted negative regulator of RcsB-dependent stress response